MPVNYSIDDVKLLGEIRDAILANSECFEQGADFLRTQYSPDRLRAQAFAEFKQHQQSPLAKQSDKDLAEYYARGIEDEDERQAALQHVQNAVGAPPNPMRWSPAACISRAMKHLIESREAHHDARGQAILLLAVMAWDANADARHKIFSVFGPWGIEANGQVTEVGRWVATYSLHDPTKLRTWMSEVRKAWIGLPRPVELVPQKNTTEQSFSDDANTAAQEALKQCSHSSDFTSVVWRGQSYAFRKGQQAESIKVLWKAYESGTPTLSQETIGERIGSSSDSFELRKVFRYRVKGDYVQHPAWRTMITSPNKGIFSLKSPESVENPENPRKIRVDTPL